ncbi:MAG: 3-oxoacyl-[acyl-carrier-protein] reductase [Planctomycetota bacterium]|nr:MAG: 3-oxoacyl-[acyl-carrier-protein] reductase [Planctomycetota bacterium]
MLADRKALVTGASRGIGRAIALAFAREGADLALLATRRDALEALAEEVRALGRRASVQAVDLRDGAAVQAAVDAAREELGGLDIVVNNAGITCDQLLLRHKEEDFQRVLDVNLTGAFRVTKAAARALLKSRCGRIITVSSVVGLTGNAGQSSYAASKAGLVGFAKSLAQELARRGVTSNVIAPGFIETDMTAQLSDEQRAAIAQRIPLGRVGRAEDVARAAVYLASDHAAYVTGVVLRVDGGLSM